MRRLSAIALCVISLSLSLAVWSAPDALAFGKTACYCRYTDMSRLFDADEKLFCPNEVGFYNLVDDGFGDDEEALCQQTCTANGQTYVGVSKLSSSGYPVRPGNMAKDEKEYCVFSHFDSNHLPGQDMQIDGWTSAYKDCKLPLSLITGSYADACSHCYCKFKQAPGIPADCVGKTTYLRSTGDPGKCNTLCVAQGYESGEASDLYGGRCDFKVSDSCKTATNASMEGCKNLAAAVEAQAIAITSQGSVLTLPLPLSNISVSGVVARILKAVMGLVGGLALLLFVSGGLRWMLARGNADEIAKAKKTLIWTTLGILAIFSSYTILNLVINALTKNE